MHCVRLGSKKFAFLTAVLCLFFNTAWRPLQPNPPIPHSFQFEQISIEQGLSQSSVTAILQDQAGFLWFGTEDGLNRYDGYSFLIYKQDREDPYSLQNSAIRALYEDRAGNLWIGTQGGGLDRFDRLNERFIHYFPDLTATSGSSDNAVQAILEDRQGVLWVGARTGGLSRLDPGSQRFIQYRSDPQQPGSLGSDDVRLIFEDRQGLLWIGTQAGLDYYDRGRNQFVPVAPSQTLPDGRRDVVPLSMAQDSTGRLWVGTTGGLLQVDAGRGVLQRFRAPSGVNPSGIVLSASLNENEIRAIREDPQGGLWLATYGGGLNHFDPQMERFTASSHDPADPHSLGSDYLNTLYIDRSGLLWAGTYGAGASKLNPNLSRFKLYTTTAGQKEGLNNRIITALYEDRSGLLWIGTYGGGVNLLERSNGRFLYLRHDVFLEDSLSSNQISAILEDSQGRVWVGTNLGLDRLDPDARTYIHYRHEPDNPDSMSNNAVLSLLEGPPGELWVGTEDGLNRLDVRSGAFTIFRPDPNNPRSISGNRITTLYRDRQERIWVGTGSRGLNRFDAATGTFVRFQRNPRSANSLSHNSILSIYEDRGGRFWVGTAGGGLNWYDPASGSFGSYTERDGLPNNVVYGILEDQDGYLWLSTNQGLSRFDLGQQAFWNFTSADGLQGDEFNPNAFFQNTRGELFFGGMNGLNIFDPRQVVRNAYLPPVAITAFSMFNQPVRRNLVNNETIELTHQNNFVSFDFAALDFNAPEQNEYAYRMEGLDPDWVFAGSRRHADYPDLEPGRYVFRVKASNNDGLWNEAGVEMVITILPPVWGTWWFRALAGAGLLMLVAAGFRLRVRQIQEHNQRLEALVKTRTRALEERTLQEEQRRQELEALYRAGDRMQHHVHLDEILQALVDVTVEFLQVETCAVLAWDGPANRLRLRAQHNLPVRAGRILADTRPGSPVKRVVLGGQPLVFCGMPHNPPAGPEEKPSVNTTSEPAEIFQALQAEGIRALIVLPVEVSVGTFSGGMFGAFAAGYSQPRTFSADEQRLLTALVQRAAIAIEAGLLHEQAREIAVLEERSRLARDLHDSAKQKAFAALAELGAAQKQFETSPRAVRDRLVNAESLVQNVIQDMVVLIEELYPTALKERGLVNLVREYAYEWASQNEVEIDLYIEGQADLPLAVEQALYRVVQEGLANIARHSHSPTVQLALEYHADSVTLKIIDAGQGFDLETVRAGVGLRSMRERLAGIQGWLEIDSQPGQGTRILAWVPAASETKEMV